MNNLTKEQRVQKARQRIALFERDKLTDLSLFNDLSAIADKDSADEILALVPEAIKAELIRWIRGLPDVQEKRIIVWGLPPETTLKFKEWLQNQDRSQAATG